MRKIYGTLFSSMIVLIAAGQKKNLVIPEFKNVNTESVYATSSLLTTYTGTFDIMISMEGISNWSFNRKTVALAYQYNQWYKIIIDSRFVTADTSRTKIEVIKIKNTDGDSLWSTLVNNKIFEMKDDRTMNRGSCTTRIFDAGTVLFTIITKDKYKPLSFDCPELYEKNCPGNTERMQIINCIRAFERYL